MIGINETERVLREIMAEMPDRLNPTNKIVLKEGHPAEEMCLYKDENGNRCFGGEAVARLLGESTADVLHNEFEGTSLDGTHVVHSFTPSAMHLLQGAQTWADNILSPLPWGKFDIDTALKYAKRVNDD